MTTPTESPVSFKVHVARLPKKGMPVKIEAEERERLALAGEHDLLGVESFRAELLVAPWRSDGVRVTGRVEAQVTQSCVVTLEPVHSTVTAEIDETLLPENSRLVRGDLGEGGEIILDPEGPDAPDVFTGDTVDVGALAEEHFELAIDPYPRSPGAELENAADEEPETAPSPFAKLAQLRRKD